MQRLRLASFLSLLSLISLVPEVLAQTHHIEPAPLNLRTDPKTGDSLWSEPAPMIFSLGYGLFSTPRFEDDAEQLVDEDYGSLNEGHWDFGFLSFGLRVAEKTLLMPGISFMRFSYAYDCYDGTGHGFSFFSSDDCTEYFYVFSPELAMARYHSIIPGLSGYLSAAVTCPMANRASTILQMKENGLGFRIGYGLSHPLKHAPLSFSTEIGYQYFPCELTFTDKNNEWPSRSLHTHTGGLYLLAKMNLGFGHSNNPDNRDVSNYPTEP